MAPIFFLFLTGTVATLPANLPGVADKNLLSPDLLGNRRSPGGLLSRSRRYLGLSKRYKLNKRYQECVAPGDLPGHCKHSVYCQTDSLYTSDNYLNYLCVIAETHVGICCPDDIVTSALKGSGIIMNLPAGGEDFDGNEMGCGLPTMSGNGKTRRWPWIVALYKLPYTAEQFCGGVLITEQHVLTAAHCFIDVKQDIVRVRLGEYDFLRRNETRTKDFTVISLIIHEEFNIATYENDIAIIKLEKPTSFNTYVWPICLPPVGENFENKTGTVAGWGQIYLGGPTSEVLLEINVPIWPQELCLKSYTQRITENNVCAAGYDGNLDSCKGDSGGPLLYQLQNGKWVTIGIVSWGIGCGNKGLPGVYTRVDRYIPWIITNTIAFK